MCSLCCVDTGFAYVYLDAKCVGGKDKYQPQTVPCQHSTESGHWSIFQTEKPSPSSASGWFVIGTKN